MQVIRKRFRNAAEIQTHGNETSNPRQTDDKVWFNHWPAHKRNHTCGKYVPGLYLAKPRKRSFHCYYYYHYHNSATRRILHCSETIHRTVRRFIGADCCSTTWRDRCSRYRKWRNWKNHFSKSKRLESIWKWAKLSKHLRQKRLINGSQKLYLLLMQRWRWISLKLELLRLKKVSELCVVIIFVVSFFMFHCL